jgi:hypothetical protein
VKMCLLYFCHSELSAYVHFFASIVTELPGWQGSGHKNFFSLSSMAWYRYWFKCPETYMGSS